MAFSNGVKAYVKARAVVEVNFPIDWNDKAHIACVHCKFYRGSSIQHKCGLNGEVVNFPERYVGSECPLIQAEVEENV